MKFPAAYYLIILYAAFVFQPLFILVQDSLSHTFAEASHLNTVHAKYGENHVELELSGKGKENQEGKNHNSQKTNEEASVHNYVDICSNALFYNTKIKKKYSVISSRLATNLLSILLPPPKFSC